MNTYKKFIELFLKKDRKHCILSVILVFLLAFIQGFITLSIRVVLDKIPGETEMVKTLIFYIVVYTLAYFGYNLISIAWYMCLDMLGGNIIESMRENLIRSIKTADYEKLLAIGRDKLKNILYMDTLNVFSSIALQSIQAFADFIIMLVFLGIAVVSNYKLGIALASGAGIGYLISYLSRKQIIRSSREVNAAMKSDNQVLNEYIDAIEIDKQNDVGNYFNDRCKNSLWKFINTSVRVDKKQIFLRNLINHFHQIFSIGITIYLMMASENTTGQIVFFMMVADIIIEKSVSFENSIYAIHRTLPSFENIEMINALEKPDEGMEVSKIKKIELKNLSFWYENAESSLIKNLNAEFQAGDIVRVAGKNGSGKSTVLKLLSGLLTAKEGEIRYNGADIRNISGSSLRKQILCVAQDEVMLNEPLEDYLRIIRSGTFHEEEYLKLLKELDVDIHTDCITDGGKNLSNGQRKKLLMIKLLLYCKEASVILIDEIDAGLDIKTREKWNIIEKEIIKQNPECILFKISHDAVDDLNFYTRTLEL